MTGHIRGYDARPEFERFWEKVGKHDNTNECWIWVAARSSKGGKKTYGVFTIGSKRDGTHRNIYAHVWSYLNYAGSIPEGYQIDHLCKNILCVNPKHLEAVTCQVNLMRSTNFSAIHAQTTHCPQGHPYDEGNTYIYKGQRTCRTCHKLRSREDRKWLKSAVK